MSFFSRLAAGVALLGCSPPPAAAPPPAAPAPPPPPAPAPAAPAPPATVLLDGGCDEAKLAYLKECHDTPSACAETSTSAGTVSYGSVLNEGAFLSACSSPPSTAVKVCAAIRRGHVVAVTVTTTPGDTPLSTCIGKAVQALSFPPSPRLDVASTVFDAQ
jgi:hypothetical protein